MAPRPVRTRDLTSGNTTSCGCQGSRNKIGDLNKSHGMARSSEYSIWSQVKGRCTNPANPAYKDYGGRGITLCAEWFDSFETFLADMGPRPASKSLDRVDNSKGYSKDNCRWATPSQQQNNRRDNRILSADGKTMSLTAWAKHIGIGVGTLHYRLENWPLLEALGIVPHVYAANNAQFDKG